LLAKTSDREPRGAPLGSRCLGFRDLFGFAQKVGVGGQPAAALAGVFDIFQFTLAEVLFVRGVLQAAIIAFPGLPLGVAQMARLLGQGAARLTDINPLCHNVSSWAFFGFIQKVIFRNALLTSRTFSVHKHG
jgi:hypothetical protein